MSLSVGQPATIRARWGLILICLLVAMVYSNTFDASWHFDDFPNIVYNHNLRIEEFSIADVKSAFMAYPSGHKLKVLRGLPSLTFALNWYWGKDDTTGYHVFNLLVHLVTAIFLFLTIRLLFQTPLFKGQFSSWTIHSTALLTSLLWAINPVQIQSVTYIVQRMAAMAAMFTIIGLYTYLRGRLQSRSKRIYWYAATILVFICALLSKENAILFPLSILLFEWIFFSSDTFNRKIALLLSRKWVIAAIFAVVCALLVIIYQIAGSVYENAYGSRYFTLWQRLISQPRILVFYLSLLFYPAPWRLSIEHGIEHSQGLFQPWTTLPSILIVIGLVAVGLLKARKTPLVAFAILFFFANHLLESTILPLELVFEHRNYLPSLFIFLPVGFYISRLLQRSRRDNITIFMLVSACLTIVLSAVGYATYERNKVWRSDYNLWYDTVIKAPDRARPLMALSYAIGWGNQKILGGYDIIIGLLERAVREEGVRIGHAAGVYQNMAVAHLSVGYIDKAFESYELALKEDPRNRKLRFDYIEALLFYGKWDVALQQLGELQPNRRFIFDDLNYKALIHLWMDKPDAALDLAQQALAKGAGMSRSKGFTYHIAGAAMTKLGHFERGQWFFSRALRNVEGQSRGKMMVYFSLIENRIAAGDEYGTKDAAYRLLAEYGLDELINVLKDVPENHLSPPVQADVLAQSLSGIISEIAVNIPMQISMAVEKSRNEMR